MKIILYPKRKKKSYCLLLILFAVYHASAQLVPTPDTLWGDLFIQVQMNKIFQDNKTFVDAVPKGKPSDIMTEYYKQKTQKDFDLKKFVEQHFTLPGARIVQVKENQPIKEHLEELWDALTRKADTLQPYGSLLPLPESYVVPGGRFREVYYWDSYFTMQGLAVSKRYDLIEDMLDNFKWLIDHYGHIPNGNRNYYLSRSQPPYYALMVSLLAEKKGPEVYKKYFTAMEKEYRWWMEGENRVQPGEAFMHVVKLKDGSVLNRYRDRKNAPREESYIQDVTTSKEYKNKDSLAFINLRSAAESGWDFSSRWFGDTLHLNTIETTNIIPVDLNCLLYSYETILSKAAKTRGLNKKAKEYELRAEKRKNAILNYCWNNDMHFFFDYDFTKGHTTNKWSIAGMMPLFVSIADNKQASYMEQHVRDSFLKDGGIISTIYHTGQQWDAPNGWAPLQWITVKGLMNYHYDDLAKEIGDRWMSNNERVFSATGKMLEKYNVENIHLESGGGEYPTQDGFGWSNGVYLKFYDLFRRKSSEVKKAKAF